MTFPSLCFHCSLVSIALQCLAVWCGSPPSLVHSIPSAGSYLGNSGEACAAAAALTTSFLLVFLEFSLHDFYKALMELSASGSQLVTQYLATNNFCHCWHGLFCCFCRIHWLMMPPLQSMVLL